MFALPTSLPMMTVPIIALPSACTKKSRIDLYQPVFQRTQYRRTLSNYRPEIWEQTKGKITHLIACSGPAEPFRCSQISKGTKSKYQDIRCGCLWFCTQKYHETKEFDNSEIYPYRIEGLGKNLIPTATDFDLIDKFTKVTDEQSAHATREIAKKKAYL
jgi:cysteine synthase